MTTFITVFTISFFIVHSYYGVKYHLKSIYILIRLTWGDKHDYFFKLINNILHRKDITVSHIVDSNSHLITIAGNDGITYFIDVNLIEDSFVLRFKSTFCDGFIFGEELNHDDSDKLNKLIQLAVIKNNQRNFLDNFEIETYKK